MSKYKSNHLSVNSNELPEKDLKLSSSNSNSRSNSCNSRSGGGGGGGSSSSMSSSSTSINKMKSDANILNEIKKSTDQYNAISQQQPQQNNNHRQNYNNTNLLMGRNYSSQMDIPLCNSTSIGSASSLLAGNNNRNHLTASYLNFQPQNSNLAYTNYQLANSAASAQHIDRILVNRLSGLNMHSPNTIYSTQNPSNYMMGMHHTLESTNSLVYQPPSCMSVMNASQPVHESLIRRDTEIDRLRMRILLLEQQIDTNGQTGAQHLNHNSNSNNDIKLTNLEYETAMLRMNMNNNSAKDEQINKLDSLLNQKEYELEEAEKNLKMTTEKFEKEISKLTVQLNVKEEEQYKEKNKLIMAQKENEKLQIRLNECNDYINSLLTPEETKEKETQIEQLKSENNDLQAKLTENEKKCIRAKQYIRDKMNEVKQLQEKLDAANMDTERIRIQFEAYREETKEVGELLEIRDEKCRIYAENETNKKLIKALEENKNNMKTRHEAQMTELKDQLKHEMDTIKRFEKILENKESETDDLKVSVKKVSNENQQLTEDKLNLTDKLKTFEAAMSADTLKFLYRLFEELNGCILELNSLVKNCIDLHNKEQVEVDSLLNIGRFKSHLTYEAEVKENGVLGLVNADYILTKTKEIKECRKKIAEIRNEVTKSYADHIGDNVSCVTQ